MSKACSSVSIFISGWRVGVAGAAAGYLGARIMAGGLIGGCFGIGTKLRKRGE